MNNTTDYGVLMESDWTMPESFRMSVLVIFSIILTVGIVGNLVVLAVVGLVKTMQTTVNLCLAALALADLGVLTLLPIRSFMDLFNIDAWFIGRNFCLFLGFYDRGALVCSVLISLFISLERYVALCYPLRSLHHCNGWKVGLVLAIIWLVAGLLSTPYCYITRFSVIILTENRSRAFCYYDFHEIWMKTYETSLSCLIFLLPVPVLCYLYGRMVRVLQTAPLSESQTCLRTSVRRSRAQVIKMLISVVVIFVICNVPFRIYILLYIYREGSLFEDMQSQMTFNWSVKLLTYVNNSTNPIIYFAVSTNFRQGFRKVFCKRPATRNQSQSSHSRRIFTTSV